MQPHQKKAPKWIRTFFKKCQPSVFHMIYNFYDIFYSHGMENPTILVHQAAR